MPLYVARSVWCLNKKGVVLIEEVPLIHVLPTDVMGNHACRLPSASVNTSVNVIIRVLPPPKYNHLPITMYHNTITVAKPQPET